MKQNAKQNKQTNKNKAYRANEQVNIKYDLNMTKCHIN
jgi:hypothetical protein